MGSQYQDMLCGIPQGSVWHHTIRLMSPTIFASAVRQSSSRLRTTMYYRCPLDALTPRQESCFAPKAICAEVQSFAAQKNLHRSKRSTSSLLFPNGCRFPLPRGNTPVARSFATLKRLHLLRRLSVGASASLRQGSFLLKRSAMPFRLGLSPVHCGRFLYASA